MHLWGAGGRERDPVGPPQPAAGLRWAVGGCRTSQLHPSSAGSSRCGGAVPGGCGGAAGGRAALPPPHSAPPPRCPLPACPAPPALYISSGTAEAAGQQQPPPPVFCTAPPAGQCRPPQPCCCFAPRFVSQPHPPQISPLGPPRAQSRGDLGEGVPASAVRAPPAAPRPTILRGGGEAIGPSAPPPCVELWGWGCGGGM